MDAFPDMSAAIESQASNSGHGGLRSIKVTAGQLAELATQSEAALIALEAPIFQRGKRLVRPATQEVAASQGRRTVGGTGKSYLGDTASALATGRPCPVAAAGRNGDETDKRLVGLLLAGFPNCCIDNINGELGSDLLCQAVERPVIRLRRLGGSDISELETRATVFANGNGMRVRGDMTRPTLLCDLDAEMERPELRTFKFDPVERVLSDRGPSSRLASVHLCRSWVVTRNTPPRFAVPWCGWASQTLRCRWNAHAMTTRS
jgi:hypothetical protein